jgi:hypothetical protein
LKIDSGASALGLGGKKQARLTVGTPKDWQIDDGEMT